MEIKIIKQLNYSLLKYIILYFILYLIKKVYSESLNDDTKKISLVYETGSIKKSNIVFDNKNLLFKNKNLFNGNSINENSINCNNYDYEKDLNIIRNYKGGELEPEWDWVKNISIVYTWVDGSDPNFINLKSKYNGGIRKPNNHRDRTSDELRYSIRSIEKYLPWHEGTIFIVTCGQIPKWLDTSNPRIKMVFHEDIFPKHVYPTYDSNTIELFLDNIPGLSERFLYLNDDFFLNNYIHPSFFFTSKTFYPKIYRNINKLNLTKEKVNGNILNVKMFIATCYNTRELIKEYFDKNFVYYFLHHSVFVLYRDLYKPFRQLFQEELKVNYINKFRNHYEVQILYLYQEFMKYSTKHKNFPHQLGGDGKVKEFKGTELRKDRTVQNYSAVTIPGNIGEEFLRYGSVMDDSNSNKKYFTYLNTHSNILVFCINDGYSKSKPLYEITEFMINKYPNPSSFEKKEYSKLESKIFPKLQEIEKYSNEIIKGLNSEEQVSQNKINLFKEVIYDYKLSIIHKYINEKSTLSGSVKSISDDEEKEVNILLNYSGEELNKEWEWVKNISIVYILINNKEKDLNENFEIFKLKYSLISLKKYLPWHNGKIFIVTTSELINKISTLNNDNDNIEIINMENLLPNNIYHSRNIVEMYIDRIPDISEKFVYLKNNQYFINYIHPQFFFDNQYYPKYALDNQLSKKQLKIIENKDKDFIRTYKLIKDYFGERYVKGERYLNNYPIALYRDLFEPVRQLYNKELNMIVDEKINNNENNILPIYLLVTYNMYGTENPFYPNYIAGFGKLNNYEIPKLNSNRTIYFYGYNVLSPNVESKVILKENILKKGKYLNNKDFKKIKLSKKLFFTIEMKYLNINNIFDYIELMKFLYI